MQATFAKSTNFTVRQIGRGDWEILRDFLIRQKQPAHFHGYIKEDLNSENYRDLYDPGIYQALFDDMEANSVLPVMFGVFDKGKLVGHTSLFFEDSGDEIIAVFAGSERADDYRGQGIGDILYEAREQYLRRMGFRGRIKMTVRQDNPESCKAASRHNFIQTDVRDDGYSVLTMEGFE